MSNEHSVPKWSGRNQVRSDLAPHLNFLLAKPKSQELGMAVCAALTKWISATHIWKSICVSKVCLKHRSGSETLDAEHLLCVTLRRHCIWRIWGREGGGSYSFFWDINFIPSIIIHNSLVSTNSRTKKRHFSNLRLPEAKYDLRMIFWTYTRDILFRDFLQRCQVVSSNVNCPKLCEGLLLIYQKMSMNPHPQMWQKQFQLFAKFLSII